MHPLAKIRLHLATHGLRQILPNKYVPLVLGGKLEKSPEVVSLLSNAG